MRTPRIAVAVTTLVATGAATAVLGGCTTPEQRLAQTPLSDFLVQEKELPTGFQASAITGEELLRGTEGVSTPTPRICQEPTAEFLRTAPAGQAASSERAATPGEKGSAGNTSVGEFLEYPAEGVVVALLLTRPLEGDGGASAAFAPVDRYLQNCRHLQRSNPAGDIRVTVTPRALPSTIDQAQIPARSYYEELTISRTQRVSSYYLYGVVKNIGVVAILRSQLAQPSSVQISSWKAIFAGQIEKIHKSHG